MTKAEFINGMMSLPAIIGLKDLSIEQKRDAIDSRTQSAVNYCLDRHPFPFACDESTVSGGSVVDQSDYSASQDAASISVIIYGENEKKLQPITLEDADALRSQVGAFNDVVYWADLGIEGGAPKFRLFKTPDVAGQTIKYRFRRKNFTFEEWPDSYTYVIEAHIIAALDPNYTRVAENAINSMIGNYAGQHPINPAVGDPDVIQRNIERNDRFGYGGSIW